MYVLKRIIYRTRDMEPGIVLKTVSLRENVKLFQNDMTSSTLRGLLLIWLALCLAFSIEPVLV